MPVPPWDKHYDVWGLGPEPAVIHEQTSRQVCMVISLPLLMRHLEGVDGMRRRPQLFDTDKLR
eukprot:7210061-Alexandrium_andersonii.AAC.1